MSEPTEKKIVCPSCDGEGWDMYDGHGDRDCQVCSGRGEVNEDSPEAVSARLYEAARLKGWDT